MSNPRKATVNRKLAGPGRDSEAVPEDTSKNRDKDNWRSRAPSEKDSTRAVKNKDIRTIRFDGEQEVLSNNESDEDDDDDDDVPRRVDTGSNVTRHQSIDPMEFPFRDIEPLPSIPKPGPQLRQGRGEEPIPRAVNKEPAYKNKAPVQDEKLNKDLVQKVLNAPITISTAELASCSPEVREELKRLVSKKRVVPGSRKKTITIHEEVEEEEAFISESMHQRDRQDTPSGMLNVTELPMASWVVLTQADDKVPAGSLVINDPVTVYLESLKEGEKPQEIFVARDSQSLRTLYPRINNVSELETVVDGGSMIVSMNYDEALYLGVVWDPDIVINMQSANGGIEKTCGLAKNVPFLFKDITLYMQCHVIKNVAYKVLLGRPFDVLTTSVIHNTADGKQLITITDPNSNRRITMPTYERGKPPVIAKKAISESVFRNSMI